MVSSSRGLFLCQRKYATYTLVECGLSRAKPSNTSMEQHKLAKENEEFFWESEKDIDVLLVDFFISPLQGRISLMQPIS